MRCTGLRCLLGGRNLCGSWPHFKIQNKTSRCHSRLGPFRKTNGIFFISEMTSVPGFPDSKSTFTNGNFERVHPKEGYTAHLVSIPLQLYYCPARRTERDSEKVNPGTEIQNLERERAGEEGKSSGGRGIWILEFAKTGPWCNLDKAPRLKKGH